MQVMCAGVSIIVHIFIFCTSLLIYKETNNLIDYQDIRLWCVIQIVNSSINILVSVYQLIYRRYLSENLSNIINIWNHLYSFLIIVIFIWGCIICWNIMDKISSLYINRFDLWVLFALLFWTQIIILFIATSLAIQICSRYSRRIYGNVV